MAKDVDARYQSADDLRADLLNYQRGRPVMAAPATIVAAGADAALAMPTVTGPPQKPPPEPPRRRWGAIFATLLGLALLAAVVVYLLVSQDDSSGQPLLDVPSVVGQQFDQGKALLEKTGFEVQSIDDETSPQAPGTVVAQDPGAGRRAEKGSTIVLTVSSTTKPVPDVVGQQFDQANATLVAAGFKVSRVDSETPDQPPGTVLTTDPAGGAAGGKGGTVIVTVAVVPGVPVPDVAGQDQGGAEKALTAVGLIPKFTGVANATVAAGKVIGTNPPAGTKVQKGSDGHRPGLDGAGPGQHPEHHRAHPDRRHQPTGQRGVQRHREPGLQPGQRRQGHRAEPERRPGPARHQHHPDRRRAVTFDVVSLARAGTQEHGRHDLAWRHTRDPWAVLVSEVMLHQTQVPRVEAVWPAFMARFPTPEAMAAQPAGRAIEAWGRLGYPRRARRLWESAVVIARDGWPDDLASLPGVGRYTANAVAAQTVDADLPAIETNVRRVLERTCGQRLTPKAAEVAMAGLGAPAARARPAARAHGRRRAAVPPTRAEVRRVPVAPALHDARPARRRDAPAPTQVRRELPRASRSRARRAARGSVTHERARRRRARVAGARRSRRRARRDRAPPLALVVHSRHQHPVMGSSRCSRCTWRSGSGP